VITKRAVTVSRQRAPDGAALLERTSSSTADEPVSGGRSPFIARAA
jgi:hypothetical protein